MTNVYDLMEKVKTKQDAKREWRKALKDPEIPAWDLDTLYKNLAARFGDRFEEN